MKIAGGKGKKGAKDKGDDKAKGTGKAQEGAADKKVGKDKPPKDKKKGKDKPVKDSKSKEKKADKKKPAKDKPAKAKDAAKPPMKKPDGPVEQKVDPDMPEGIPLALYSRKPKRIEQAPVEKCPECTFPFRVHPREQDVQCPHCFEFLALVPEHEAAREEAAKTDALNAKAQPKKDAPREKTVSEKPEPSQDAAAKKKPSKPVSPQFDLEVEQVLRPRAAGEPQDEPRDESLTVEVDPGPEHEKEPQLEAPQEQAASSPAKDEGKNNRHPSGDPPASKEEYGEPEGPQPVEAEPVEDEAELEALPSFELEGGDEGGSEAGQEAPAPAKKSRGRGLLRRKGK